jgi:hypothetical protein
VYQALLLDGCFGNEKASQPILDEGSPFCCCDAVRIKKVGSRNYASEMQAMKQVEGGRVGSERHGG